MNRHQNFPNKKRNIGSVAVEYMVLIVMIGLALILSATSLGNNINATFKNIGSYVTSLFGNNSDTDEGSGTDDGSNTNTPDPYLTATMDVYNGVSTNNNSLDMKGRALPGAIITLYDEAVSVGNAIADANGDWLFTFNGLREGNHVFTAGLNTGDVNLLSNPIFIRVDITAPVSPTVGITAAGIEIPSGGQTGVTQPTFHGTGEAGSSITISNSDGTVIASNIVVNGEGQWSYVPKVGLANGTYTYFITSRDVAGNISEPTNFSFNINKD